MKILLIEDETVAARQLKTMVLQAESDAEVVGILDSVEGSVNWLRTNPVPDLILMDIELVDGQSFEIFSQVEVQSPVIFTTAYDEFALKAFRVNSIDYLLKPIEDAALRRALQKFQHFSAAFAQPNPVVQIEKLIDELARRAPQTGSYRERFLVRQGQRLIPVDASEVAYFFSQNKISFIKTYDNRLLHLDYTLDELEQSLNPRQFYRANRQFIVGHKAVEKLHFYFNNKLKVILRPASEEDVIVSREKAMAFRRWLGE
ncbi:LytTR family DNA-binding domain-containing protein [Larkinella knui]|uniref:DNA-binding response regulator n=1 Tax=Larkinella knui TaxID=2025310 RepID=A0A3P1CWK0_9BACT|nr:LytTR family DNA-binding domain-containing protein [Larkinella knui]RRB17460.1 DNA-binding response regulator [Larkinella knui]